MTSPPSVSIITPCYNGEKFLRETLDCVLGQTYPAAEVIVIDDGSTDASARIAESYGPPVRVIVQQNQGESVARNKGISEASCDYILFLDADDLLDPTALERLVESVGTCPGAVALMGCAWFEHDPARPFAVKAPPASSFFPSIISGNIGPIHCWLVPRELLLEVGNFAEDIQQFEDWDLWCQIALKRVPLVTLDYIGAYYRRHEVCQSVTSPNIERCRGHAAVMRRLSDGVLQSDDLLQRHGEPLFWSAWTSLNRARRAGMGWKDLEPLVKNLAEIASRGPREVRESRFGRLIRLCGVRCAETVRNVLIPDAAEGPR